MKLTKEKLIPPTCLPAAVPPDHRLYLLFSFLFFFYKSLSKNYFIFINGWKVTSEHLHIQIVDIFPFYSVIYFHSQVNLQEEGDEIDFRHLNGGDVSWHSIIFQRYMSTLNNYCHVTKILTQPVVSSKALHMYLLDEISVLRSAKANTHSVRRLNNETYVKAIVQLENVRGHLLC